MSSEDKNLVECWLYWIHAPHHNDFTTEGYIGITTKRNPISRFTEHKKTARNKDVKNRLPVHNAIVKYGDKICFSVLLKGTLSYCLSLERQLRPTPNIGYNVGVGGASPRLYSKASAETRIKLSIASRGRVKSEETRRKMSEINLGKIMSHEAKLKMSASRKKRLSIPWNNTRANLSLWKDAVILRDIFLINHEMTCADFAKLTGYNSSQIKTIFRLLKNGWNPLEDSEWITTFSKD